MTTTRRLWRFALIVLALLAAFLFAVAPATGAAQASSPRPKPHTIQVGGQTIAYYTPAEIATLGGTAKVTSHAAGTMTVRSKSGVIPFDFAVGNGHTGGLDASLWTLFVMDQPVCVYGLDTLHTNNPAPLEIDLDADYYHNGVFLQQLTGVNYGYNTLTLESNCWFSVGGLYENTAYGQAIWGDATGEANATDWFTP
jgi:hypothetical protein